MPNKIWKKGLVVGITILLVVVSVLSSVSSKDVSVSNEKIVDNDDELDDNNKISMSDDYDEIFSLIRGWGWMIWKCDCTMDYAREVSLFDCDIVIWAVTKNLENLFYRAKPKNIYIENFNGYFDCTEVQHSLLLCHLIGYAIGDISWS